MEMLRVVCSRVSGRQQGRTCPRGMACAIGADVEFLRFVGDTIEGELRPPHGRRFLDTEYGSQHASLREGVL